MALPLTIYESTQIDKDLIQEIILEYLDPDYKQQYEYVIWQFKILLRDLMRSREVAQWYDVLKQNYELNKKFYRSNLHIHDYFHAPLWTSMTRDRLLHDIQKIGAKKNIYYHY